MKVSMNGLRRSLSADIGTLREIVSRILNDDWYDKEDLTEAMNDVIRDSNVLNCVFIEGDSDFVDMNEVEVETIET